ncbi:MAG TPA: cbb3-type cytochrome c oxidase subunit I [Gemmatimonadaceae bacterium]
MDTAHVATAEAPGITPLLAPDRANGAVLRVGLAYLVAGLGSFLLMGVLGFFMRLDQSGIFVLSAQWFYRIMTLHGAGMVASILLAGLGGLAAAVSATTRLSARVLWIVLVIYMAGMTFTIFATLLGGFAAGWTVLYPLPTHGLVWSLAAALAMYVGYLFVALGLLLYAVHILVAVSRTYGGLGKALALRYLFSFGRDRRDPLPRPVELIAAVISIDSIAAVTAGTLYLVPIFLHAAGVMTVDALYAKDTVYIFGHTMANLSIYVTAGLVYAALPSFTKRAWPTTWAVVIAWDLIIILMLANFSHHIYADFAQPVGLQLLAEIGSYAVALPSFIVTIIGALALIYRSGLRWTVAPMLLALGIWGWVFGGLGAVLDSTIPVNQVMHNTMWVPAHFHTYYLLGAVAFAWGYFFYMVAELSGTRDLTLTRLAPWLYGIGGAGFIFMFFVAGAHSVPRRYAVHLAQWQIYARIAVPFVLVLALGLAGLAWDLMLRFRAAWRGTQHVVGS